MINHEKTANNLELEVQTLKGQLQTATRRENELFNKNMLLESEAQDKSSKMHNLTLQSTQLQTNNNNILQMLENYEVKVNTQNKKIKGLENELKELSEGTLGHRKEAEILEWKLSEKER